MRGRGGHAALALLAALGLVTGCGAPQPAYGFRHPSGVQVVPAGPPYVRPSHPPSADALAVVASALDLARRFPGDLGCPWTDEQTGGVVLDVVSDGGHRLAERFRGRYETARVAVSIRWVRHSYAELAAITDSVGNLKRSGVPDGQAVVSTRWDAPRNRVEITVSRISDALLTALAARFGPDAIAVRLAP